MGNCVAQENKEKDIKKGSPKYEVENANQVKNQLNVDEQQDAKKYFKGYCDIDDIEPQRKDNAVCKRCNQTFA